MSEPVFITCTAGANAFADFCVRRKGNGLEIVGHPLMLLTEAEAEKLADTIRDELFRISVARLNAPSELAMAA